MKKMLKFFPVLCLLATTGCVTVYQPLVSLQRPVAVDPQQPNFSEVRVLVRCFPDSYLDEDDAQQLCNRVRTAFVNQGATVEVEIPGSGGTADLKPQFVLDLKSRLLHEDNSPLLWVLSGVTFTLIPGISEYTFAADVEIHDPSGSLLIADTLQGRFVRYFGAGVWVVNKAADLLVRSKEEKLTGDAASEDFSRDFYRQISQLMLHAKTRALVLRSFEAESKR
ncbi:MAG: hypothetical protein ACT4TC_20490 [Myxococcaceae bacterium]